MHQGFAWWMISIGCVYCTSIQNAMHLLYYRNLLLSTSFICLSDRHHAIHGSNPAFWKLITMLPRWPKHLAYSRHSWTYLVWLNKIALENWLHGMQVYAIVHRFSSRLTPVKGLSLTILALKWFGNYGIKKVKGCLQSTWWERILCVLCGQLCCCVFYAAVARAGRENSNTLDMMSLLPKITKI